MPPFLDITGMRFGKLTAIRATGKRGKITLWECMCDCGNICIAKLDLLRKGTVKSCGCYRAEFRKLNGKDAAINSLYGSYKKNAKDRNLTFDLTIGQFCDLTSSNCYYCGIEPQRIRRPTHYDNREPERWYVYNGIDRVDNSMGYTIDNVVPCCFKCNSAKKEMTIEDFKEWINRIYNHMNGDNNERRA